MVACVLCIVFKCVLTCHFDLSVLNNNPSVAIFSGCKLVGISSFGGLLTLFCGGGGLIVFHILVKMLLDVVLMVYNHIGEVSISNVGKIVTMLTCGFSSLFLNTDGKCLNSIFR